MAQILLTGATGFLGAAVAAALDAAGLDWEALDGRLETIRPRSLAHELVVHCAAAVRHRPAEHDAANRRGTERLLAGLRARAGIVFASSRGVYATTAAGTVDETAPVGPADSYGRSKLAAERLVRASGHRWVSLRLTTLFGFGVHGPGRDFPAVAVKRWLDGECVTLHEPDRPHDYLYVHAAAALIADLAAGGDLGDEVLNVAGPPRSLHRTMAALAEAVRRRCASEPPVRRAAGPPPRAPLLDTARLRERFPHFAQADDCVIAAELVDGILATRAGARTGRSRGGAGEC